MKKSPGTLDSKRLMDRLRPEPVMGQLVGFLATTYEMQPEFLETDLLPTLFGLGAWDDRSWTSRITLERRLAEIEAAVVLLDARAYQGRPRSLRVEINPLHPSGARRLLHAKIFVAVYTKAVRMIIGSANLTEPGYRRNREIVAVLTATPQRPRESALIADALDNLRTLCENCSTISATNLSAETMSRLRGWAEHSGKDERWFVWGGGGESLFDQFMSRWPSGEQVRYIRIVSPFWSEEDENGPIHSLVLRLRSRGQLAKPSVLELFTDAAPDTGGTFKPRLPASFRAFDTRTIGVDGVAIAVDPRVPASEIGLGSGLSALRGLHAKVVIVEGDVTSLAYLGSANFTRHGWGFLSDPLLANIEAGIVIRQTGDARPGLNGLIPAGAGRPVRLDGTGGGRLVTPEPSPEESPWPGFLTAVLLSPSMLDQDTLELRLLVDSSQVEGSWNVSIAAQGSTPEELIWSSIEAQEGSKSEFRIPLRADHLRRLLGVQEVVVSWWHCPEGRPIPLNVDIEARASLPISPEGGRINEGHLIAYYQGRIAWEELFPDPESPKNPGSPDENPSERSGVDTSRIQSYIVREFIEALKGLTDDLKAAASSSRGCMRHALLGAVSPVSLARQVFDAATEKRRSPTAAGFQLVEILGCLEKARGFGDPPNRADWTDLLGQAIGRVQGMLTKLEEGFREELPREFRLFASTIRQHYRHQA